MSQRNIERHAKYKPFRYLPDLPAFIDKQNGEAPASFWGEGCVSVEVGNRIELPGAQ